jgi:hypothetical protein
MKFPPVIFISLVIFTSCQSGIDQVVKVEKFSENRPYALKISRERSFYQADKISSRMNDMGIHSYIIQFSDTLEKTGDWFQIMCGAIENIDSAVQYKAFLSHTYNINNAEIVKYDDFSNARIDINYNELEEIKKIESNTPDVPNHLLDLTKLFPDNNALYVNNLSIINSPEKPEQMSGYDVIYKLNLDLPRGISRRELLDATNCFAEVVYKDNIYGDKVIVDIGVLRQTETIAHEASILSLPAKDKQKAIANEFAEKILSTGEYPSENKEEIEINAATKLQGYKVTISLWNNQQRTYLVLVDESLHHLVFSQSTDKSESELVEILQGIGSGNGLLNYSEFYNTFFTIPDKMPDNDKFIAFGLNRIDNNYARSKSYTRWAKEMVGHWQASGYFVNSRKGNWSYSLFDLLTEKEQNYIYKTLYWKEQSKNKQTIKVLGTNGIHVTSKKFNWKKFKTVYTTLEINFGAGRYVCAIDNSDKSWLSKNNLLERAEALQIAENSKTEDIADL